MRSHNHQCRYAITSHIISSIFTTIMKNHSRLLNGVFIAASELVSCIALVGAVAVCASASDEEEQLLTTTALVQQQMNDRSKKRKTLEQLTEQPLKKKRAKFPYDREAGRKHVKYYFVGVKLLALMKYNLNS